MTFALRLVSELAAQFAPPPPAARLTRHAPSRVPPRSVKFAVAVPLDTVSDVAVPRTLLLFALTVKVTVPSFTVAALLVTVAVRTTVWLFELKLTGVALAAVVVVAAGLTVSAPVLLLAK